MSDSFIPLEAKIHPVRAFLVAFQHILAMFVPILTPPLLVANAIHLTGSQKDALMAMALFSSGLATLIQVSRFAGIGSGMLSVQGTSFTFVPLAIQAGLAQGMPLVIGMTVSCAFTVMLLSRFIFPLRRVFAPIVTGSVVMLIGLTLIKEAMFQLAGGHGSPDFGAPQHVGLGLFVIFAIVVVQRFGNAFLRSSAIALGLGAGFLLAVACDLVLWQENSNLSFLALPQPLSWGWRFEASYVLPWMIAYLITAIESIGDITATSQVSKQPVSGPLFLSRLRGGLLADGLGSVIAGLSNALPTTTFAQNNGIIHLTGVASRRVGFAVGLILICLGMIPALTHYLSCIPGPALGGAALVIFGVVTVSGLKIVLQDGLDARSQFILAVTLGLGLGVVGVPNALSGLAQSSPEHPALTIFLSSLQVILGSGITVGTITAISLNLLLPKKAADSASI